MHMIILFERRVFCSHHVSLHLDHMVSPLVLICMHFPWCNRLNDSWEQVGKCGLAVTILRTW